MNDGKFKKSSRIANTNTAIARQLKIAKHSLWNHANIDQPHRWAKRHAMDCGRPRCMVCGNPRKIWNEKTFQEEKFLKGFDADNKQSDA